MMKRRSDHLDHWVILPHRFGVPTIPDAVKPAVKKAPVKKKGGISAAGPKAIAEAGRKRLAALRATKKAPVAKAASTV
jgi:hypothetical protein